MNKAFQVHMLTEEGKAHATAITEAFNECLQKIEALVPVSRELLLVTTKLEEACFFAKKGMAQQNSQ